jgi:putative Mg2+ transporter-C (MgtC) family protein
MTNSFLAPAILGTAMPLELTWLDMAIRLVWALIAGAVIGLNRGERGKAAELRTTMLVCLAAAIAMLQMNYLLTLAGRSGNSFVMNDLMRLPLGILTGVGFIGGGAILRRGNLVIGVTTAAGTSPSSGCASAAARFCSAGRRRPSACSCCGA